MKKMIALMTVLITSGWLFSTASFAANPEPATFDPIAFERQIQQIIDEAAKAADAELAQEEARLIEKQKAEIAELWKTIKMIQKR